MAKRALRKREDIEAVPLDQPVELDLSPDDPIVIIEPDSKTEKKDEPVRVVQAEDSSEEVNDLRKQLEDMRKAEESAAARAIEAERQAQEANRRSQELEQQNSQSENSRIEAEYDSILSALDASKTEMAAAKQAKKQALEIGDYAAVADADERMALTAADIRDLERGKAQAEHQREIVKTAPKKENRSAVSSDPLEAHIAQLPDLAKTWIRKNREYMTDESKNVELQMAHLKARKEGVALYSPRYIEFIEQELGMRAPKADDEPAEPARRTPVSAPVSREIASPSTGKATPTRVTLTAEERDIARSSMPNTDPGEAERIYAQNKLKLQKLKQDGHYQER